MDEITQDKLELLRVALPKGLSAGDSGLGGFPEKPFVQPMSWPQFQSTTSDAKLYTGAPAMEGSTQVAQSPATEIKSHPWAIYSSVDDDDNVIVKIEFNSNVYQSTGTFDVYPVTGLDAWTAIQEGYIILEASVSLGTISGISVQWGDDGTSERSEWDGDNNQTKCRIRIGYIYQDANNNWVIRQDVFGQLTLVNTCSDGKSTYCFFQT